jgi:DNA polymerase elongation subunit (family B)
MSQSKALVFDIETFPILAYVWELKDQNIGLNQIHTDWSIAAWGAKWLGTQTVVYQDRQHYSEKKLLKGIWQLLDEADIVITQNGKSFDSRRLNARFIHYGMNPPSPYKHIDTYLLIKSAAAFTSNKLEYLTDKLNKKYKKLSHGTFPGMLLWKECLKNNPKAWKEMRRYNINDVLSTEELYNHVKAWGPKNMPRLFTALSKCPVCGEKAIKKGRELVGKTFVQRVQCRSVDCGKWSTEPIAKKGN